MKFQELPDKQWDVIQKHLPKPAARTGRPRFDDHTTINGIMFVLITDTGEVKCLKGMAQNQRCISDCKTGRKKESGKTSCLT